MHTQRTIQQIAGANGWLSYRTLKEGIRKDEAKGKLANVKLLIADRYPDL